MSRTRPSTAGLLQVIPGSQYVGRSSRAGRGDPLLTRRSGNSPPSITERSSDHPGRRSRTSRPGKCPGGGRHRHGLVGADRRQRGELGQRQPRRGGGRQRLPSGAGGGVFANLGTITVDGSTINGNVSTGSGGGIWNGRSLIISNTPVTRNQGGDSRRGHLQPGDHRIPEQRS